MNKEMNGFKPKYHGYIEELRANGFYYEHEKTGAELFFIHANDDNKVFSVGFSTVPTDDTGVAHITEHCVLCGSEKYPLKELFMTLNKSSLNTYLNAMTFPDKTIYPVASQNEQDFMNLIDVYMDSVFHPTMYRDELFFRQEGHGFDFEHGEEGIPSGIVYNEMKGAMASPDSMLSSKADRALFTNTYAQNSGGEPEAVLDLKYEDFLAFHKKHYHPSNARFYVYGNADIEKICAFLDACISKFEKAEAVAEPVHTPYDGAPRYVSDTYPTGENTAVGTMNFVIGSTYEIEKIFAASVLSNYLFEQSSSAFKKSLLESGFCSDLYGGVDDSRASATIYLTMYGLKEFDPKKVEERVFEELKKIDKEELTKTLRATLNYYGFGLREFDTGSNPRGMVPMFNLLLHTQKNEDPFARLRFETYLKKVEEMIDRGEHLKFIESFMTENNHRVSVVLSPRGEDEDQAKDSEKDNPRWNALTDDQKKAEREWYDRLRKQQESPDSEEALAALPKVRLADVPKDKEIRDVEERELDFEGGKTPCLFYKLDTGIMYVKLFFPVSFENKEDLSLFSVAVNMLGNADTEHYTLAELGHQLLLHSGGMKCGLEFYKEKAYFYIMIKALPEKLEKNFDIAREILSHTKLTD
ncbi:MAG: insulinase family protein, partial [Bacillota bacterium]|nr:insulinase family protein [Bacillota bacterium]